ncbi:hypothetical protein ACVGWX_04605, partial [Enterobacter hormaechei]
RRWCLANGVVPGGAARNPPTRPGCCTPGKANPPPRAKKTHKKTIPFSIAFFLHFLAFFTFFL